MNCLRCGRYIRGDRMLCPDAWRVSCAIRAAEQRGERALFTTKSQGKVYIGSQLRLTWL